MNFVMYRCAGLTNLDFQQTNIKIIFILWTDDTLLELA